MKSSFESQTPHEAEWDQRLEEWRDGLSASHAAAIESHIASCGECQSYLKALDRLDAALSSTISAPLLAPDFAAALWSRIDSGSQVERALAKQRAQAELQQELAKLSANWRRKLALALPGVLAGVALAFWLVSAIGGLLSPLVGALQQHVTPEIGQLIQAILTALLGGAAGLVMSQWVGASSD
jgi:anti-sigma factor RsiW